MKSSFCPALPVFLLNAALFISCNTESPKEEASCVYRGQQVSCEEFRRLEAQDNEIFADYQKMIENQRKSDSAAFARDSASIQFVVPRQLAGAMAEIPAGSYQRADGGTIGIRPFNISNVETTAKARSLWTGKDTFASGAADLPAPLSWTAAVLLCNIASLKADLDTVFSYAADPQGKADWSTLKVDFRKNGYRLPTEAEWEYAARGGRDTRFYWGDSATDSASRNFAWSRRNADRVGAVAKRLPNQYGLYDMFGNAAEYTLESVADSLPAESLKSYPPASQDFHVLSLTGDFTLAKGGSYLDSSRNLSLYGRLPISKSGSGPGWTARLAQTRVPDGVVIDYYPDGNERSRREYKGGRIVGTRETFYRNGDVLKETFDGGKTGQRLYDSTGAFIERTEQGGSVTRRTYKFFGTDSLWDGPYTRMWNDSVLLESGSYVKGLLEGVVTHYRTNGMILQTIPHVKGQQDGLESLYDTTGMLLATTPWAKGLKQGIAFGWSYPAGGWKPRHNTETLWENSKDYPMVTLTYAADDSTIVQKMNNGIGPVYHLYLTYYPDKSIRSWFGKMDTTTISQVIVEWFPSGTLKTAARRSYTYANKIQLYFTVPFAEDGTCLENCAKLMPGFIPSHFNRPVDSEGDFYRGKPIEFHDEMMNTMFSS